MHLDIILRFLQSPRNRKDQGGGAKDLGCVNGAPNSLKNLATTLHDQSDVVRGGSGTYRTVLSKATIGQGLAKLIAGIVDVCRGALPTLLQMRKSISRVVNANIPHGERRKFKFTTLHVALDLFHCLGQGAVLPIGLRLHRRPCVFPPL